MNLFSHFARAMLEFLGHIHTTGTDQSFVELIDMVRRHENNTIFGAFEPIQSV